MIRLWGMTVPLIAKKKKRSREIYSINEFSDFILLQFASKACKIFLRENSLRVNNIVDS